MVSAQKLQLLLFLVLGESLYSVRDTGIFAY